MSSVATAFDIKSASLDLLALILRTDDQEELIKALTSRFGPAGDAPAEAFLLDVENVQQAAQTDYGRLLPMLGRFGIRVLALRHPDSRMADVAARYGLAYVRGNLPPRSSQVSNQASSEATAKPVEATAPASTPTPAPASAAMIIDRPVRAGQQIYARGGDLIVLAMVSAGAEVIADGNIHIYAPLRGRALAGARGNTAARIFVRSMEAELVSIAGVYRTIEQDLPESIKGKSSQIYLENERLVMTALGE